MTILASMSAAVLLLAAAVALLRALPMQNVFLIIASLSASELALRTVWGDPILYGWDLLFWPAMIIWARVGVRWLLRRHRKDWNYGIWLMVLASAAVALMQLAIELPGGKWSVTVKLSTLRFAATAFCLFWLSPWFISKLPQQPHEQAQ